MSRKPFSLLFHTESVEVENTVVYLLHSGSPPQSPSCQRSASLSYLTQANRPTNQTSSTLHIHEPLWMQPKCFPLTRTNTIVPGQPAGRTYCHAIPECLHEKQWLTRRTIYWHRWFPPTFVFDHRWPWRLAFEPEIIKDTVECLATCKWRKNSSWNANKGHVQLRMSYELHIMLLTVATFKLPFQDKTYSHHWWIPINMPRFTTAVLNSMYCGLTFCILPYLINGQQLCGQ